MLKGISPFVSPDLLKKLSEMGHGDEMIIADANFPGCSLGVPVLRADGVGSAELLAAIMPLIELDQYVERPLALMAPVPGDAWDEAFVAKIHALCPPEKIDAVERFAFYERARHASFVVMTGEKVSYGNILIKKGVI